MPELAQEDEQAVEDLVKLLEAIVWVPLTNDINIPGSRNESFNWVGSFHYLREKSEGKYQSVSPDPFEETLEDEKGSLDSKGSS